ncbi:MAG: hypothetical protein J6A54_02845, partial [Clostridia bacterium]|nr:hypothetical protein [Clostridia bacterium]
MKRVEKIYRGIPFWSWNDELDKDKLVKQVEWMDENGIGGFFMHARGGPKTQYLGEKWHECIDACAKRASELGMEAYAYDENGWPSGFVGGKLLEDIENHDRYLTYKEGEYDKDALASYDISGSTLKRVHAPCNTCLNVYEHYSASTADILNPEVVDQFLALTHEEYRKRDKFNLKGFFTDEPQYYRWGMPYTKMLPKYFRDIYGEDILDGLGFMFVEREGYRAFRYKFWKAMQALMLEGFAKKIYDWCDKYGYKLTGHYIDELSLAGQMLCCGGVMPFYEYEHIPGIDYLGKGIVGNDLAPKQVSSVCAQLGKRQILTETFAGCGWSVTPRELKRIAEMQYAGGVNLMCHHLLPFEEHGQRKRDYPAHFSSVNPWVKKGFGDFNDYFSYLGKLIAESDEVVNVGVLHPIRSAYFDFKRFPECDWFGLSALEKSLDALLCRLCALGIGHHLLDETILARHAHVENGTLVVGKCKYDYIILPKIYTMDKTTEALLSDFVAQGGKILLTDDAPKYLEGEEHTYSYLKTNTSWAQIIREQPYSLPNAKDVRATYRRDSDGREFIYIVNLGEKKVVNIKLKNGTSFASYDIMSDSYRIVPTRLTLDAWQSCVLYASNDTPRASTPLQPLYLKDKFEVVGKTDNYFTLDFVRYSKNGVDYTESLHHMGALDQLLKDRYEGKLYLKYEFNAKKSPRECVLFVETPPTALRVNGKEIASRKKCELEVARCSYDIAGLICEGKNEIVLELDYYQGENVYYALFGENVTEGLKNCLAYDTEIEPIYLKGSFGVYGDFEPIEKNGAILGDNFYMAEQKREISSLVKDGFPFLAGSITLKQQIIVKNTKRELVIDKPFHLIDVKVNGKGAGRMLFSNRLDISKHLKKGKNELEITLTTSNRN